MRAWSAIAVARYCFIASLGANTSAALMRSDGARNSRSLNSPSGALVTEVVAHAAQSSENTRQAQALTWRLLPRVDYSYGLTSLILSLRGLPCAPAGLA